MTEIVEISGKDRVLIIRNGYTLAFKSAMTLSDAEYQAAVERVAAERIEILAEAMGEHVLLSSKAAKPEKGGKP